MERVILDNRGGRCLAEGECADEEFLKRELEDGNLGVGVDEVVEGVEKGCECGRWKLAQGREGELE